MWVSDKIIASRLGHSNTLTTIKYYEIITHEVERDALKGISLYRRILKINLNNIKGVVNCQ